ncbi:type II CRISPR RNA-guided endonuclease Cas9 [Weissella hellenica]|uniref:type II CRISPR RNA-guided endonuclease Cas9 n=1 Tax=Weissella hellenica TaxID=46256 RepID=UPI00388B19F0
MYVPNTRIGAKFIDRLTGTDTYLMGEPTLPKNSLVYQKYNVLQELNNLRLDGQRLDVTLKQDIFEHVFKAKLTVSKHDVTEYIASVLGREKVELNGFADTIKFNSNLGSYHYLRQALGESFITSHKVDELDEIITLQTVFEDKSVLANQLATMQLDLTQQQIDKLKTKHWTGWGRLSHKLLTTPTVNNVGKILPNEFDNVAIKHSIIDTLFATQLNLMEIINNNQDLYEVRAWITEENQDTEYGENVYDLIQNLAGGKEIKRGITQSFRILDDIVRAMGEEPERVYLEFARETQESKRTVSRQQRLLEKYKGHSDLKELQSKLNEEAPEKFKDDRLYLYYLQQGKDLYTGNDLNIDNLVNYDVDHIVPQAYTKDNSFDNRVLVSQSANREKSNAEGVPNAIRQRYKGLWQKLLKDGFMTRAKYNNLTMNISEKQKRTLYCAFFG